MTRTPCPRIWIFSYFACMCRKWKRRGKVGEKVGEAMRGCKYFVEEENGYLYILANSKRPQPLRLSLNWWTRNILLSLPTNIWLGVGNLRYAFYRMICCRVTQDLRHRLTNKLGEYISKTNIKTHDWRRGNFFAAISVQEEKVRHCHCLPDSIMAWQRQNYQGNLLWPITEPEPNQGCVDWVLLFLLLTWQVVYVPPHVQRKSRYPERGSVCALFLTCDQT